MGEKSHTKWDQCFKRNLSLRDSDIKILVKKFIQLANIRFQSGIGNIKIIHQEMNRRWGSRMIQ
ncbi:hypothetical protein HMPREF3187_01124 [Aerococcus christensenii]|uniref:Uncharacterized protein n=1 Tax=Aerococcus christensenii TaxID=87541 RepID=A0A133XYH2_9LACT|nr:hypothetical protein HMPREF3187_01124 [Aerococcus christensenii]